MAAEIKGTVMEIMPADAEKDWYFGKLKWDTQWGGQESELLNEDDFRILRMDKSQKDLDGNQIIFETCDSTEKWRKPGMLRVGQVTSGKNKGEDQRCIFEKEGHKYHERKGKLVFYQPRDRLLLKLDSRPHHPALYQWVHKASCRILRPGLGIVMGNLGLDPARIEECVREKDKDGSGFIDFEEFCSIIEEKVLGVDQNTEIVKVFQLIKKFGGSKEATITEDCLQKVLQEFRAFTTDETACELQDLSRHNGWASPVFWEDDYAKQLLKLGEANPGTSGEWTEKNFLELMQRTNLFNCPLGEKYAFAFEEGWKKRGAEMKSKRFELKPFLEDPDGKHFEAPMPVPGKMAAKSTEFTAKYTTSQYGIQRPKAAEAEPPLPKFLRMLVSGDVSENDIYYNGAPDTSMPVG